jgi:PAS domain-containing protein
MYARTTPVTGQRGETLVYVGVSVDISERRRAEEELRQAEVRYRTLVERLPALTYVADLGPYGRWRFVSPQIESMLGYTPEEWRSEPGLWLSRLHPEDRARVTAATTRAAQTG